MMNTVNQPSFAPDKATRQSIYMCNVVLYHNFRTYSLGYQIIILLHILVIVFFSAIHII